MKILFAIAAGFFITLNVHAQQFTIKGTVTPDAGGQQLFLSYRTAEGTVRKDSAKIVNGMFLFQGRITAPAYAWLYFSAGSEEQHFILDPAQMKIHVNADKPAIISGSATQSAAATLDSTIAMARAATKALSAEFDSAQSAYETAVDNKAPDHILDSLNEVMSSIHEQLGLYNNKAQDLTLQFVAAHPDSYLSIMKLQTFINVLSPDSLQHLYNGLSSSLKESAYGRAVSKDIQRLTASATGHPAPDFRAVDINNKPLRLAAFKGTYVLLDFWASWCVPCREANPHLITVYNKYKNKGFTIIGVADDNRNPKAWHKAVEKDQIGIWFHVLRGPEDLNARFGIQSLPAKVLIDRNGVIIGRYNSEEDGVLEKTLQTLL